MKNAAIILTVFFTSFLVNNAIASEKKNEKTVTFSVSMDCQGCVNKIQDNISYEKGVKDLKVSLDNKECTITYREDKTTEEKLIKAFNKIGYTAAVKKEKDKKASEDHEHIEHDHSQHK